MLDWLKNIFRKEETIDIDMKYLIVGLGNIGEKYEGTRHNIGFDVVDEIAERKEVSWDIGRNAMFTEFKMKGRQVTMIKPTTFMNLSGKALSYWVKEKGVKLSNTLIVVDDLHLDLGVVKLKLKGSDGGHNGLKDIARVVGNTSYPRLRVGIGKKFRPGQQVNFVLGTWKKSEQDDVAQMIQKSADAVESFISIGSKFTMEKYNRN